MKRIISWSAIAAIAGVTACDNGLEERVDALENRIEAIEKRPAPKPVQQRAQPRRPDPSQVYYLPVGDDDPYRGAAEAKVTIVEAYEFACPYCAIVEPVLAGVVDAYKGTDKVKVVSKQFVVHPDTATAAALATCAANKQGRFEPFAEALWKRSWATEGGRPRMQRDGLERKAIVDVAANVGLDKAKFEKDLDGAECKAKLAKDRQDLARIGIRGTPSLYVNGRPYMGPRTVDALKKTVEAELARFEKARGSGPVAGWYDQLMKGAKRTL